ncbi:hypothetical protein Y032_0585g323 [Ancylostoma ceylanicum]|uniref:BPTI/Kunitz inhibitor domain-containing protein n=1 Tax=Ancylostoma ceylanicum TaxID=53326 RepID=A0A016WP72_9BILA|nr:hypothetical protein Y032_0585g323 [Ancylostoma ceylanicum]
MLPRWLLLPLVVTLGLADDGAFLSAMKNLFFGSEQYNATGYADLQMHPAPSSTGYPTFRQLSVGNSQSGSACMMPQQIGTGPYRIPRWYFNPARGRCELFYWSGCCGNGNNFQTFQSCQSACEVSQSMAAPSSQLSPGIVVLSVRCYCCLEPYSAGYGHALLLRFYFDVASRQCKPFVYRGAGGFGNVFESKQICQSQCQNESGGAICPALPRFTAVGTSLDASLRTF